MRHPSGAAAGRGRLSRPSPQAALSGIDGALWDILGKRCGVPVYQLLGGKVRTAVPLYGHASAKDLQDLEDQVRKHIADGYRHVRVQGATAGFSGYGVSGAETSEAVMRMRPTGTPPSPVFEPTPYVNNTIKVFDYLRAKVGFDVELLHDVHERLPPTQAIQLCKAVEPYRPFFTEDPFAPVPDVAPADLLRHCCEFFNVRTAWHGPGNVSPIGHAVNMHPDLASSNFGIQEQNLFSERTREMFPGAPEIRGGYMYANEKPGLGVDINEALAAKFPYQTPGGSRGNDRRLDGTIVRP